MSSFDVNREMAHGVEQLAAATRKIATSITADAAGGSDVNGGHVESLTEAVMGASRSLQNIAEAIGDLAQAVREHGGAA